MATLVASLRASAFWPRVSRALTSRAAEAKSRTAGLVAAGLGRAAAAGLQVKKRVARLEAQAESTRGRGKMAKYDGQAQAAAGAALCPAVPVSATRKLDLLNFSSKALFGAENTKAYLMAEILARVGKDGKRLPCKIGGGAKNLGKPTESVEELLNRLLAHHGFPNLATCAAEKRGSALVPKMADLNYSSGIEYRSASAGGGGGGGGGAAVEGPPAGGGGGGGAAVEGPPGPRRSKRNQ